MNVLVLVSGQYHAFPTLHAESYECILIQLSADFGIDGGKWVVHDQHICVSVQCPSKANASPLTTAALDPPIAHNGLIAGTELLKVDGQSAGVDNLIVPCSIKLAIQNDVLLYRAVHDPWILRSVS